MSVIHAQALSSVSVTAGCKERLNRFATQAQQAVQHALFDFMGGCSRDQGAFNTTNQCLEAFKQFWSLTGELGGVERQHGCRPRLCDCIKVFP
ncbi:hypothetical protein [Rhabdochromatium marinum]|uniref:hypothetical protein n=1 Tax=Rhabdochromatium marinum TaxID=48729 RepID=UPI001905F17C|nr:hypothetical protein [Rhabdochromatium marinum]